MRRLEMTCDLCGMEERFTWSVTQDPIGSPTGWQRISIKGIDSDVCPVCWKEIVIQVKARLPAIAPPR